MDESKNNLEVENLLSKVENVLSELISHYGDFTKDGVNCKEIINVLRHYLRKQELNENNINKLPIYQGATLLDLAIENSCELLLRFLRLYEIDYLETNYNGERILETIARKGDSKTFDILLGKKFKKNLKEHQFYKRKGTDIFFKNYSEEFLKKLNALQTLNKKDENLLIIAVGNKNVEIVKCLLSLEIFDVNYIANKETAASVAWVRNFFEIFYELIIRNAKFPENFSQQFLESSRGDDEWLNKIFIFISEINEIHNTKCESEIIERVEYMLENFPKLKFFYNVQNESLLLKIAKNKQFEVYDNLMELGLELETENTFHDEILNEEIYNKLPIRAKPSKIHFLLHFDGNYIKILEANAHFIASEEHPRIMKSTYFKIIQKILRVLESVPMNVKFMKLLAAYNHKKVIYDFSNSRQKPCVDNKKYLNRNEVIFCCEDFLKFPVEILTGEKSYEEAITAKKNAKQPQRLFDNIARPPKSAFFDFNLFGPGSSRDEELPDIPVHKIPPKENLFANYASVAHELAHWAIQLVYENHCKPYAVEDKERKEIYEEVLRNTNFTEESLKDLEASDDKFHHAEVPVRIPQLLTLYLEDSSKVHKIKETFPVLFQFFDEFILPDVEKASRIIYGIKKVEEINLHCGVEELVQEKHFRIKNEFLTDDLMLAESYVVLITSNCPILALTALRQIHFVNEENRKFKNATMTNILHDKLEDEPKFLAFVKQTQIFIKDFREPILDAFNSCENSILIVFCKKDVKLITLIEILEKLKTFKRVIFVTVEINENKLPLNFKKIEMNFEWSSLTDHTRERILQNKIFFQGNEVELGNIFADSECDEFLEYFVNSKELDIGRFSNIPKIDFHLERNLIEVKQKLKKPSPSSSEILQSSSTSDENLIEVPMEASENVSVFNTEYLLQKTKDDNLVLISDLSGSGKTTELIHIAHVLKEKNPFKMIFYIDLEKFTNEEFLERLGEGFKYFNSQRGIAKEEAMGITYNDSELYVGSKGSNKTFEHDLKNYLKFLGKICLRLDRYERKVFEFLIKKTYVIILIDGFDVIYERFDKLGFAIFTNSIKLNNQFWFATKKEYQDQIKERCSVFKFARLNDDELKKFLTHKNCRIVFEKIKNQSNSIQNIGEMMKLILLIEIKNLDQTFPALFDVFEKFFEARYKKFKTQITFDDFLTKLEKLALAKYYKNELLNVSEYSKISRLGIVKFENNSQIKFTHETFPEFLIARYVWRNLIQESEENFAKVFIKTLNRQMFEFVWKLIEDKLIFYVKNPAQERNKNPFSFETKRLFLNEVFHMKNSSKIIKNLIHSQNLLELITEIIKNDSTAVHKMWVEDNENKSVFLDLIDEGNFVFLWKLTGKFPKNNLRSILCEDKRNILSVIAQKNFKFSEEETTEIQEVTKNFLSREEISESSKNTKELNVYQDVKKSDENPADTFDPTEIQFMKNAAPPTLAVLDKPHKFEYFAEEFTSSEFSLIFMKIRALLDKSKYAKLLTSKDVDGHSIMFYAVKNNMKDFLEVYIEDLLVSVEHKNDIKELFTEENIFILINDQDTLRKLLNFIINLFDETELSDILHAKVVTTENPLFDAIRKKNQKVFKDLVKFYKDHNLIDIKSYTVSFIYPLIDTEKSSKIFKEVNKVLINEHTKDEFIRKTQELIESVGSLDNEKKDKLFKVCEKILKSYT